MPNTLRPDRATELINLARRTHADATDDLGKYLPLYTADRMWVAVQYATDAFIVAVTGAEPTGPETRQNTIADLSHQNLKYRVICRDFVEFQKDLGPDRGQVSLTTQRIQSLVPKVSDYTSRLDNLVSPA